MDTTNRSPSRRERRRKWSIPVRFLFVALLAVPAASLAGCGTVDEILEVENEQDILDQDLNNPEAASAIAQGVAADYAVAFVDYVISVGLYSNELIHTGSFPSWREWEQGIARRPSGQGGGLYDNIARATFVADDAVERFREVLDDANSREETARALVYAGMSRILYADGFCQATFNGGAPIEPDQIYQDAEAKLDEAIQVANAAGSITWRNRAHAVRAHLRLMTGDFEGARADAQAPPQGFRFDIVYSTNSDREENDVVSFTKTGIRREAGVHADFYSDERFIADPRTPFIDRGPNETGPDPTRQYVEPTKYTSQDDNIPASTWQELRLIEAEAELELGNWNRAVELIDEVRTAVELDPYDGPITEDAVRDQIFYERSAEMWLQGKHWKDQKRFGDPRVDEVRDVCWEISQDEWETNPNLAGGG